MILCTYTYLSTGKNTLKFQLTINPFGLITHASSAFGGKASDKYIFLDSGILNKFEESDALMVDKGYAIAHEVNTKGKHIQKINFNSFSSCTSCNHFPDL